MTTHATSTTLTASTSRTPSRSARTATTSTSATADDETITTLTRSTTDGSLSEPDGNADCLQDHEEDSEECPSSVGDAEADGISDVTGVAVSPDGDNVYTTGSEDEDANGSIAEFSRGAGGRADSDWLPRHARGRR